jgi:hypothetical protein
MTTEIPGPLSDPLSLDDTERALDDETGGGR